MGASSPGSLKQNVFNLQYLTKKFNAIILFSIHVKQKNLFICLTVTNNICYLSVIFLEALSNIKIMLQI